ncbi:hypothetical protein PULV_b0554 [Pseudoalteromonas ulvae UL12]|uniref:Lipid kinase YegS n=1 Tax=Pseudoalteromonas ulvae TaxID=107327 RepID=A0A244CLR7_PSEDV|nr:lipid kinase YegS [Pseudoalteromonas ulvae]MBE0365866.1 hypothetical protein [Pseudoalteromonas ulvae UL12]OUL56557.1 lipid kinase YegS [Pseudoalteromonas ulvae]
MKLRLLLNGKKASQPNVRDAVMQLREQGWDLEVRVTWEGGDIARFVAEAVKDRCSRIIAGGGDGTVNEAVNALMQHPKDQRPELAILPLGTANDFATACEIPTRSALEALVLAAEGQSTSIDLIKANQQYVLNIATAGFGAQVTATTPPALKNFLGGGAYTLTGLIQALDFKPFNGTVSFDEKRIEQSVLVGALCNGRQAGGGQVLSAKSYINDGKIELVALHAFPAAAISTVINELSDPNCSGDFVQRHQVSEAHWQSDDAMPMNLDGEPISVTDIHFKVCPLEIALVLPKHCPMLIR